MFPEQLDRLQRRFATGVGRDSTGFGLGISIATQALEVIDGTLSFESVPGEGTRARIELPSARFAHR
jgi:signal transduction histidine kinase